MKLVKVVEEEMPPIKRLVLLGEKVVGKERLQTLVGVLNTALELVLIKVLQYAKRVEVFHFR